MSAREPRHPFVVPDHEVAIRADAIDPAASVFLTANAGSGKTTILTERVIRLLLASVDPTRILCVTYTKAAAAEMQDRIFRDLARWVRLDDGALRTRIAELTGTPPDTRGIAGARRLFARAIETPGGLKLQTIHAFSERLLHLFPFEANVPVRFTVMDELAKAELIEAARRAMIAEAAAAPHSPLGQAFSELALAVGEDGFDTLMLASLPLMREAARFESLAEREASLRALLGLKAGVTEETIAGEMLSCGFNVEDWPDYRDAIAGKAKKPTDQGFLAGLNMAIGVADPVAQAAAFADLLLTKEGELRKTPLTQDITKAYPDIAAAVDAAKEQLPGLLDKQRSLRAMQRALHLAVLADDVLGRFVAAKQARALVDFDDLIARTLDLVSHQGAAWVLQKLDAGIEHVLIDEAQDTTPQMWRIVENLTGDFFAGTGARPTQRTVFAVGDEKQSIYSFQGAAPKAFAENRRGFAARAHGVGALFHARELQLSFRTVDDVLSAVDAVFSDAARFKGLSAEAMATVHTTARVGAPGFVELWPVLAQPPKDNREVWEEVDAPGRSSAQVQLASRIARHIAHAIRSQRFEDDGAPVRAGDVMILVQRRDAFFDAVIRALKREGVPVAGADRIRLTEQIGVLDLIAAARTALLVEDDLMLATALKSPLVGLDDDDLLRIAPGRSGSLYAALGASAQGDARHAEAFAEINAWRRLARSETPAGFFACLLGARGGRRKLLARLGPDAGDAIDVFMSEVVRREAQNPPSLVALVEAFAAVDSDVKRDQEGAGDAVRVITVHGAKGLEARIVYLPDTVRLPNFGKDGQLFGIGGHLLWAPRKADAPRLLEERREEDKALKLDEYRRLLYVAMTRARDRLYVAGWGNPDKVNPDSWYAMIEAGLAGAVDAEDDLGEATVRRWRVTPASSAPAAGPPLPPAPPEPLPDWIHAQRGQEAVALPPLRPSRAADAADQPVDAARRRARSLGDAMHVLLEKLPAVPPERREAAALALLANLAPRHSDAERRALAAKALALIGAPETAILFGRHARAEAEIAGVIMVGGAPRAVTGRIDRLVVLPEKVLIADFKSGRPPADGAVDPAHAAQLALYAALIQQVYPGREIACMLVWTGAAIVRPVDDATLRSGLAAITLS